MPQIQRMGSCTCSGSPAARGRRKEMCRQRMQSGPFIIRKESGRLCRNGFPRKRIPSLSGRWVPTICADRMASCTASCIILCHILVCKDRQRCGRGETVSVEFTLFMESRHGRGHKNRCRTVFMFFSGDMLRQHRRLANEGTAMVAKSYKAEKVKKSARMTMARVKLTH